MTAPLRRFLLNSQIAAEARRIAHAATKTCRYEFVDGTGHDDEHTKNCNALKRQIEALALNVKLAAVQPPVRRDEQPPPLQQQETTP